MAKNVAPAPVNVTLRWFYENRFLPQKEQQWRITSRPKRRATKHLTPEEIPQILFHPSDRDRLIVRMFLVLGLRSGEMFALRWNDKQGDSPRIDISITEGM